MLWLATTERAAYSASSCARVSMQPPAVVQSQPEREQEPELGLKPQRGQEPELVQRPALVPEPELVLVPVM